MVLLGSSNQIASEIFSFASFFALPHIGAVSSLPGWLHHRLRCFDTSLCHAVLSWKLEQGQDLRKWQWKKKPQASGAF